MHCDALRPGAIFKLPVKNTCKLSQKRCYPFPVSVIARGAGTSAGGAGGIGTYRTPNGPHAPHTATHTAAHGINKIITIVTIDSVGHIAGL